MIIKKSIENYIIENENKIKINSQEIRKGDIFIALQGNNYHGNKFINSSIINGAKFCITDKKLKKIFNNKKIYYVKNILLFLYSLAKQKRKLFKGKVIGITGSAGKTTLKESLNFFLKKKYTVSSSYKSYNNFLGVVVTVLNMNLKSKFSIFELGTNNFGEIKNLVKIILPTQVIVTNIQSTHLENFKTKKNIAVEKSDIFSPKHNPNVHSLILLNSNKEEKLLIDIAKKYRIKQIITIGQSRNNNYYISKIIKKQNKYKVKIFINNKKIEFLTINNILHRTRNIVFCLAVFKINKLDNKIILKNVDKFKPIIGRGLIFNKNINRVKVKFIDETYNANPDTMKQSIEYFNFMKSAGFNKILILDNMNELGKSTEKLHIEILKFVENYKFHYIILCGEFFHNAIKKIKKPLNKFIIIKNDKNLIDYINDYVHRNTMILAKCSNSTIVNKFATKLLSIKEDN